MCILRSIVLNFQTQNKVNLYYEWLYFADDIKMFKTYLEFRNLICSTLILKNQWNWEMTFY